MIIFGHLWRAVSNNRSSDGSGFFSDSFLFLLYLIVMLELRLEVFALFFSEVSPYVKNEQFSEMAMVCDADETGA